MSDMHQVIAVGSSAVVNFAQVVTKSMSFDYNVQYDIIFCATDHMYRHPLLKLQHSDISIAENSLSGKLHEYVH